jgi:surface protein
MALSPQFTKKNGVAINTCDNFNGLDNFAVLFASGVYPQMGFTIKVDTSLGDASNLFTFTPNNPGPYSIYWDDETANQVVNTGITHTYSTGGQYEIACRGNCGNWVQTATNTSKQKLIDVLQWTDNGKLNSANAFENCDNLVSFTATDAPAGATTPATQTNFIRVFDFCDVWNGDLSSWDVSAAQSFQEFFRGCPRFNNSSILGWNTSNVNRMSQMFYLATDFNQDISVWDVGAVTNFTLMFRQATSFNQNISGWDVTGGGAATDMTSMFQFAPSFNQDISGWDVSNCTNFSRMFNGASSFNQDLSNWDVSSGTAFNTMFAACPIGNLTYWDVSNINNNGLQSFFQSNNNLGTNPDMSAWKFPSTPFILRDAFKFCNTLTGGDMTEKVVFPGTPEQYTAWDMSQCTDMHEIFSANTVFNGDCTNWNVGNVTDLSVAFAGTSFNQDIGSWNVANCQNMTAMFSTAFNQDLSSWNVGNVTEINSFPFGRCGDTTGWNMSSVVSAGLATVSDLNYGTWTLSSISTIQLQNGQSLANQAKTVEGWGTNALTNTGASAIPLFSGSTVFSKTATVGGSGYDGQAAYNGYLKLIAPTPNANRTSGTNTSIATDKLIDLGATFTASVNIGDVVANTTAGTYSEVVTVDSDTQLTLADDIFTSTSQAYSVDGGYGWTITGTSFT